MNLVMSVVCEIGIGDVIAEHGAAHGGRCFGWSRRLLCLGNHGLWLGIAHDDAGLENGVVDDFAQKNGVGGLGGYCREEIARGGDCRGCAFGRGDYGERIAGG